MVDFYQNPLGLLYGICATREKLTNPPKGPAHFIIFQPPMVDFYKNPLGPFVLHLYQPLWLVSPTKTIRSPYILLPTVLACHKVSRVNFSFILSPTVVDICVMLFPPTLP